MMKKRFTGFHVCMILLALLALLGAAMIVFGAAAHHTVPQSKPFTVAQGMLYG